MAWQLIYTSAPRLLEAGRTGFGTVARHRSVGGLLAAAVERLSQFARLPGHDSKRVVCSHRVINVSSSSYHVLSCLRDAGSDYTGRTNHIAHHLIAEEDEVRGLAELGITPADVLLAMPWRESWNEGARFLDAAEEIDLGSLKARPSRAWEQLTGDRRNAGLLCGPAARRGSYLITPDQAPVLELLRESLNEMPEDSWQMTFTTSLEPNDEVGDFRWIAVPGSSPLRAQTEGSSRQIFDLLSPASLPPPPEVPALPSSPQSFGGMASPARETLPPPSARTSRAAPLPRPDPASQVSAAVPGGVGGWSPERRARRAKKSLLPYVLVGVVVLLACASAAVWFQVLDKQRQHETDSLVQAIEVTWVRHHLQLGETKAALLAIAGHPEKNQRDRLRPVLARYEAEFAKIERILENPRLKQDFRLPEEESRDDFTGLCNALQRWSAAASVDPLLKLWAAGPVPAQMEKTLGDWRAECSNAWAKCAVHFTDSRPTPHDEGSIDILLAKAREALKSEKQPAGKPQEWQALFKKLGEGPAGLAPAWLAEWIKLDGLGANAPPERAKQVCDGIEFLKDAPVWLKTEAAKRRKQAEAAIAAAAAEKYTPAAPPAENRPKVKIEEVARAFEARHPIYLCFLTGDEGTTTFDVPVLQDHPTPEMHFGGFATLDEWPFFEDSYRLRKMVLNADQIKVKGTALTVPVRPEGGWLVACTKEKKVLFEARVVTPAARATELLRFSEVPKYSVSELSNGAQTIDMDAFLNRLRFVHRTASSIFHLVSTEGKNQQFELLPVKENVREIALHVPVVAAGMIEVKKKKLRQDIENLEAAIRKDDNDIKTEEAGKFTDKETKVAKLKEVRARHEAELAARRAELAAIDFKVAAPRVRIASGKYFLRARFASNEVPAAQDLCLVTINVSLPVPKP